MKSAPRFPSRWACRTRTLGITVALSAALGACQFDPFAAREGTIEYPGSGAAPGAAASYVVKYKDTIDGVSERFGVSRDTIIASNKLQPPYTLVPGRTISLPGARVVEGPRDSDVATAAPPPPSRGPIQKEQLPPPGQGEAPRSAAPQQPPQQPPAGEPTPLSPAASTQPPAGPPPRFEWPIRGKVVSGYGSHDGQKNDGIDIAVVYAGSEVRGMGNLLLVSHSGGYITAYGFNDSLLVKKGDVVKKGQPIAKVGTSGSAPDPRLHFEVRRGNKTVDPATVLPGG